MSETTIRPPREDIFRVLTAVPATRAVETEPAEQVGLGTLTGHFAVFDVWTEINSIFEGRFLERIAPRAFKKTFRESRDRIRVLFQHGYDPQIGDKPLGPIDELHEDDIGAFYEVPLLDTSYNRDLLPGLDAGLYGASFRFRVINEDLNHDPGESEDNPQGLPERTIREAQVMEFGPVTFPAYPDATAGLRSLTDEMLHARMARDSRFADWARSSAPTLSQTGEIYTVTTTSTTNTSAPSPALDEERDEEGRDAAPEEAPAERPRLHRDMYLRQHGPKPRWHL